MGGGDSKSAKIISPIRNIFFFLFKSANDILAVLPTHTFNLQLLVEHQTKRNTYVNIWEVVHRP